MKNRFDGKTFMAAGAERTAERVRWAFEEAGGIDVLRRDAALPGTPDGKILTPEEMAGAARFLASEDAHITGSYMIADGGNGMLGA